MKIEENPLWPKKIKVDKKIVKILSESTYENFPQSLKELIVNSYDADAKSVNITVDLKRELVKIEDDGIGMTVEDFDFYLRIAGQRREKTPKTESGRLIVGQFGVGFLSVFPFFLNYSIESKKTGDQEILFADIPCYKYFSKEKDKLIDVSEIGISGGVRVDKSQVNKSFTRITLTGFTPIAKAFFSTSNKARKGKNSILKEDGFTKIKWYLEEDLPLKFDDEAFTEIFKEEYKGFPFDVYLNKKPLKRRVFGKVLLEHSETFLEVGNIKYRYFICSNEEPVNPSEATGFKVRNLNIGVGRRTTFGLGVDTGGTRSRLRWLTGEIHITEGLNNEIKVSRDDFYFSPDYEALKLKFASLLSQKVGILESEESVRKFIATNAINDLGLLQRKSLSRRIEKVKTQKLEKPNVKASESNTKGSKARKIGFSEIGTINADSYQKKYRIKGKQFILETKSWDFNNDLFPACKIEGNKIWINKKYPLFSKHKHLDVFIRIHLLLLLWFTENKIKEEKFIEFSKDILDNFSDHSR